MSKDAAYDVSLPSLEIIQFSLGSGHLVKRLRLYQIASRTGEGKKHLFESRFIRGYGIGDTHTQKGLVVQSKSGTFISFSLTMSMMVRTEDHGGVLRRVKLNS